jgi:hypothetical protein
MSASEVGRSVRSLSTSIRVDGEEGVPAPGRRIVLS